MKNNKINVLLLFDGLKIGGQEKMLLAIAEKLDKKKFNVFIAYGQEGPLIEKAKMVSKKVFKLSDNTKIKSINLKDHISHLKSILKLSKIIRQYHIKIVEVNGVWSCIVGSLAGKISKAFVVRIPGAHMKVIEPLFLKIFKFLKWHKLIDMFIVGFNTMAEELIQYGVEKNKIKVIPLGVDLTIFNPNLSGDEIRKELGIKKEDFVISIISRVVPDRGHDILVKAAPKIIQYDKQVKFLIVGDGPLLNKIKNMAKNYRVYDYFIFAGYRKDIPNILAGIDVAVLVPKDPCGSNFLREAMACGKAIITTDGKSGCQKSWIKNGETGILIPPNNMEIHLADAIIDLLKNKEKAKIIGLNARKYVEKYMNLENMISEIEKTFIQLIYRNNKKL